MLSVICLLAPLGAQVPEPKPQPSAPKGPIIDYFAGTWRLVSTENRYADGTTEPYTEVGPKGLGYLMYDRTGHMCAQLMNPIRPNWKNDRHPTAGEALSGTNGFLSYCGTYEVREPQQIMVHHPETAWSPNWVGTVQNRPYRITGPDSFYFSDTRTDVKPSGQKVEVVWTIRWERVK